MSSEWVSKPLSEVIDIISGGTPKTSDPSFWNGSIPWLSVVDFNNGNRYVNKTDKHITEAGLSKSATAMLQVRDIIISARGTVGALAQVGKPMAFNQSCYGIRGKDKLANTDFIYYILKYSVQKLKTVSHGAVFDTITKQTFYLIDVMLPSYQEQERIAGVLGCLDDRIALLRETNATLEVIAQTLFKSWFVDFDPVHAKQQGREPEGMDAETASLFPNSFEESELGLVPKGWQVAPIGNSVEIVGGGTPNTKEAEYWEPSEFAWTTPKDLSGLQSPVLLKTERLLSAKGVSKVSSGLLPIGTLLLSSRAPIGYLAIAQIPLAINQGYIAILPSSQLQPLYMYFWLKQNMDVIKSRSNGSTFMEISKKAFRPIPMLVPVTGVLDKFLDVVNPIFTRLAENERQAQNLTILRDTLLPRLISGQLRLPEATALLEETTA